MYNKYNQNTHHSFIVSCLSLVLSFISLISFFLESSILWLIIGISGIISFRIIFKGFNQLIKEYKLHYLFPINLLRVFSIINSFILFSSSIHGLVMCITLSNLHSNSYIYIPFVSLIIIILGNCISLYQIKLKNN